MLQIKNLSKIYKSKKGASVKALDHVSLDLGGKGLVFLLGKSGSGKSTLLNLIGGLDAPDGGEIIVKGNSSRCFSPSDFDSYRNTYVGFVFQEYNLIEDQSVCGNVSLALELQGKTADRGRIEEAIKQLDLTDDKGNSLIDRKINELSGGQKQRVAIARALVKNPQIILADEPTGALDSETGKQLYDTLKALSSDKLVIVVTHDKENAEQYGDRVIELKDGKIIRDDVKNANAADRETTQESRGGGVFIKSALPFRRSLAMGASGLKVKKFRLITSILLSVVAFTIFGCALLAAFSDAYTAELGVIYANEHKVIGVLNAVQYTDPDYGDTYYNSARFTENQKREIVAFNNGKEPIAVFRNGPTIDPKVFYAEEHPDFTHNYGSSGWDPHKMSGNNFYDWLLSMVNQYTAEVNPDTGLDDLNLRPDGRLIDKSLSKLPQSFDEIAITDLQADIYMRYGYREADGTIIDIDTPDALIGKKVSRGKFTISGVFSTEIDRIFLQELLDNNIYQYSQFDYKNAIRNGATEAVISCAILKKGFHAWQKTQTEDFVPDSSNITTVFVKLSGNMQKDRAFLERLNVKEDPSSDILGQENTGRYKVLIVSLYSGLTSLASWTFELVTVIGLIAAAVFSVFAVLLMMNFLTISLAFKKKDIGILRALGARKKDVTIICLVESLVIALIDFVISLIAIIVLSIVFNNFFHLTILYVNFLTILLLFLLVFGISALATILPVVKITNKKPIDIIHNK